jgi:tetratricopeptide (TPR) repeat protein
MCPSYKSRRLFLAVAFLLAFPCPLVSAKGSGENPIAGGERAKGTVALNLGRYEEAIEHLSQAYTMTQDPLLLFSLGQAHHLAGKLEKALAFYSAFLRAAGPLPKYRAQFERAASEIETITSTFINRPGDRVVQGKSTEAPAPAPSLAVVKDLEPPPVRKEDKNPMAATALVLVPPAPAAAPAALSFAPKPTAPAQSIPSRVYKKWWFWTSVAGAVALGGTAAWFFTRSDSQVPGSSYGHVRVLP